MVGASRTPRRTIGAGLGAVIWGHRAQPGCSRAPRVSLPALMASLLSQGGNRVGSLVRAAVHTRVAHLSCQFGGPPKPQSEICWKRLQDSLRGPWGMVCCSEGQRGRAQVQQGWARGSSAELGQVVARREQCPPGCPLPPCPGILLLSVTHKID